MSEVPTMPKFHSYVEPLTWDGVCNIRSRSFDLPFISYAGPYAEGRRTAETPEDDLTLQDYIVGVLLGQPADRDAYLDGVRGLPGPDPTAVWERELDQAWPTIQTIANTLLAGGTVTHDEIEAMLYG